MNDLDRDPDVLAMKKANRRPFFIGLGVVGVFVLLAVAYVLAGAAMVKSQLEAEGYTNVDVKMNGPLDYGFTASKGGAQCGGTVTRLPFRSSREETCFGMR